MAKQNDFQWVLDNSPEVVEFQKNLFSESGRKVFFADVPEELNLGFEVIDSFVCFCLNYSKKPGPWFWEKVDRPHATPYLTYIIGTDLAYREEQLEAAFSSELAKQFMDLFKYPYITFYSNYGWDEKVGKPLNHGFGIATATFDTAIIGLTNNRIGFLLAEDED